MTVSLFVRRSCCQVIGRGSVAACRWWWIHAKPPTKTTTTTTTTTFYHQSNRCLTTSRLSKALEANKGSFRRQTRNNNNSNGDRIPPYLWIGLGGTVVLVIGCYASFVDEAPMTNRRRWIATSLEWEEQLGDEEYQKLRRLFQNDILPPNHRASITVQRVGSRIAQASQIFCQQHGIQHYSTGKPKPFTYTVVRSDMANAFVLPGNHVFVMTGLFRYVHNEDELAAVLGHEAAHVLARHAGERVSQNILVQIMARLSLIIDPSGFLFFILVPATSLLKELPNSRQHEIEADRIGVHLAALACYDPRAAQRVFQTMKEHEDDHQKLQPPEFLSTHPSHEHRIAKFDDWMPDAMSIYRRTDTNTGTPECQHVRQTMEQARNAADYQARLRELSQSHFPRGP